MALKTGVPTLRKPAGSPRKSAGLAVGRKPVNRFDDPGGFRLLRTPEKGNDTEQELEDTPLTTVSKASPSKKLRRPALRRFAKKAALYTRAVLLYIRRLPRVFKGGAAEAGAPYKGYSSRRKAKSQNHGRLFYIGAALAPAAVLIIILAAVLGRPASNTALAGAVSRPGQSPAKSAMLADLDNVLPLVPGPSADVSMLPAATPIATTQPEPSATAPPTDKPSATKKPKPSATPKPSPKPTTKPEPTSVTIDLNVLADYYKVDADKYYSDYGYSSNHYEYTEDDVHMLAQVITREAGHESKEGKLAVGNVIINRVLCGYWGSTIQSVVTAPKQFSYNPDTQPNSESLAAARDVLKNEHWVVAQDVYFFNSGKTPGENWGKHTYYTQIGGHCFYRENIGRRRTGGDVPSALFDREYKWPQYGCKPAKRVTRVQHMLKTLGYDVSQDGYFGKTTEEGLIKFQKDKGLKSDGVAGPTTIKALIKAYGKDKYYDDYCK